MKIINRLAAGGERPLVTRWTRYSNNDRLALLVVDKDDPEYEFTASLNFPNHPIPDGAIAVKDYSENEGMVETLVESGVIEPRPMFSIPSGFISAGVYRLTEAALEEAKS